MIKKLNNAGTIVEMGNVAMMEGAIAADCKYFAGYPITPATEVAEQAAIRMPQVGGVFMQMEDELSSICSVVGASMTGTRSMTATSGPGFSLMQEGIGMSLACERPIVIGLLSRGGPGGGLATEPSASDVYQVRRGSHGDYELITLCPSSVQEMFDFTVRAFNLADKYMCPVIVMADAVMAHLREKLVIPEEVEIYNNKVSTPVEEYFAPDENLVPPHISFYDGSRALFDSVFQVENGRLTSDTTKVAATCRRLCEKINANIDDITDVRDFYAGEPMDVGIVCYGTVARAVSSAVEECRAGGINVGYLKLNTIWPVPEKQLEEFCEKCKHIIVPEMNMGQYLREVQRITGREKTSGISCVGGATFSVSEIVEAIKEVSK